MDYKEKYLKYKEKYLNLKSSSKKNINFSKLNQFGGAGVTIPNKFPGTYSFLFMPLIYFTLDNSSVCLPAEFINLANQCIKNVKEAFEGELPFDDFENFIRYLSFVLNSNSIYSLESIEKIKDGDHHIPGQQQEIITNYRTDESINAIISCLANMMIEKLPGKQFLYNK